MIAILHGHYIIHALASKRNVVCTRTIYLRPTVTSQYSILTWLSPKHCFIGRCYTVPCKSHRSHFSFLSVQSERVEYAQVLVRAKQAQVLVQINHGLLLSAHFFINLSFKHEVQVDLTLLAYKALHQRMIDLFEGYKHEVLYKFNKYVQA